MGRHSVFGNRLLRFDGVNDSLFVYGLIVFYVLISVTPRAIERKRIFDTVYTYIYIYMYSVYAT